MRPEKPITTAEVPRRFLQSAFLLGHIPQKVLASKPYISYAAYIPPTKYTKVSVEESGNQLPLLVYVHGTGRNLSPLRDELSRFADSVPCAVVAPLFPAGLEHPNDLDSYKHLRSPSVRFDEALLEILEEVGYRWPGICTDKIFLMGFSGGGQFAHRFLYLYPERLRAVSIGAPGSVTHLDRANSWPEGVSDVEAVFSRSIRKDVIRQIDIQLIIGGNDTEMHGGGEFTEWVRIKMQERGQSISAGAKRRVGRLQVLRDLHEAWKLDGITARLDVVDGVAHDSDGVRQCVLKFLRPIMLDGVAKG